MCYYFIVLLLHGDKFMGGNDTGFLALLSWVFVFNWSIYTLAERCSHNKLSIYIRCNTTCNHIGFISFVVHPAGGDREGGYKSNR